MRLPLVPLLRELDSAPRRFLVFSVFNVISWQCIAGPMLVLLGRKVGMPASWIGMLLSFLPFSMVLLIATVPLMHRFGCKRLMLATWLLRNLAACLAFAMPWAMAAWGVRGGWYVLLASVLAFCVMRAAGVGGWFPWLHSLLPVRQRGAYFSAEASVVQIVTVAVGIIQAQLLSGDASLGRYLFVYSIGVAAGIFSLLLMGRIPYDESIEVEAQEHAGLRSHWQALHDRNYIHFIANAAVSYFAMSWLTSIMVLYMRDILNLSSQSILIHTSIGSLAILLTIRSWQKFAEYNGDTAAISSSLAATGLSATCFLVLIPGTTWIGVALPVSVILAYVFTAAYNMAVQRSMMNLVPESERMGYMNVWVIGTSLAQGCAPILAGKIIDQWELAGFRFCFALSAILSLLCAFAVRYKARSESASSGNMLYMLNPAFSLRGLARIAWITIGLDKSNTDTTAKDTRE